MIEIKYSKKLLTKIGWIASVIASFLLLSFGIWAIISLGAIFTGSLLVLVMLFVLVSIMIEAGFIKSIKFTNTDRE